MQQERMEEANQARAELEGTPAVGSKDGRKPTDAKSSGADIEEVQQNRDEEEDKKDARAESIREIAAAVTARAKARASKPRWDNGASAASRPSSG